MPYILAKAEKNRKEKKGHTDTRQHRTDYTLMKNTYTTYK